jgi:hypothetical protein
VTDLGCSLTYQFIVTLSSDKMNDFARVVSSPPDEAVLYCGGHGPSYKLSASVHLLSMVPCVGGCWCRFNCCDEVKALALRAHDLDDEELQWPTVAQLVLPSLAQSTAA